MKETNFRVIFGIIWGLIEFSCAQRNRCGLDKFRCNDGQCISSELLCDGQPNCRDQSDETYIECNKPEIICPEYAFRCSYGACVDGDATCNGVKDCIDNSDETLSRCNYASSRNTTSRLCLSNQFKCNNGQCILHSNICDGTADCADKSDETLVQCGLVTCEQLLFQCSYGACIDGDLSCNGIEDCADGSDENPTLCNNVKTSTSTRPLYTTGPTRSPYTTVPTRPSYTTTTKYPPYVHHQLGPSKKCIVPPHPQHGFRRLHETQCSNRNNCEIETGDETDKGTHLIYSCNTGYKLNGSKDVLCDTTTKWVNIPVCEEIRCRALHSASTYANCQYNGQEVYCNSPVLPSTRATLHCNPGYHADRVTKSTDVTCNNNGIWESDPIECVPECGKTVGRAQQLIVHGSQANITELPWHATLYKKNPDTGIKEFICGASIIKENLLITAAHCVADDTVASKYSVATGNIFRDYDYRDHDKKLVTKSAVKEIYVYHLYHGIRTSFDSDIAIIRIEPAFTFSTVLRPICLDSDTDGDSFALDSRNFGKLAGFGRTEMGKSSAILQTLNIPYVPPQECHRVATQYGTQHYITPYKFCAGYLNGSSACDGDSGGGLAFKRGELWYLRGIVSSSLVAKNIGGTTICENESYTLFTKVSKFMDWIQPIIRNYSDY